MRYGGRCGPPAEHPRVSMRGCWSGALPACRSLRNSSPRSLAAPPRATLIPPPPLPWGQPHPPYPPMPLPPPPPPLFPGGPPYPPPPADAHQSLGVVETVSADLDRAALGRAAATNAFDAATQNAQLTSVQVPPRPYTSAIPLDVEPIQSPW